MLSLFKHSPVRPALIPDFIQKQRERSAAKVSIANRTGPVPPTEPVRTRASFRKRNKLGTSSGKEREREFCFPFKVKKLCVLLGCATQRQEARSAVKHSGRRHES